MSNPGDKPMLSVELRALLERVVAHDFAEDCQECGIGQSETWKELRAILDEPDEPFSPQGWSIDHSAGRPILMHNKCSVIEAEQAYGLLNMIESAAQHQGDPVVWVECSPAWLKAGGDCATAPRICVGREGISHLHPAHSSAEQPATVADHPQCEECKGWGYHENHHEGGGTECGECGGSGKAAVAVVMPESTMRSVMGAIQQARGFQMLTSNQCHALAEDLDYVARLNGVKP